MNTEITCIICPNSCEIEIQHSGTKIGKVNNAFCKRGIEYAKNEITNPVRVLTSTVKVRGGEVPLLSVRTSGPIPKSKLLKAAASIKRITVETPVCIGQTLVENFLGFGVDIIATSDAK